jgi:hypothetical protein
MLYFFFHELPPKNRRTGKLVAIDNLRRYRAKKYIAATFTSWIDKQEKESALATGQNAIH